MARRFLQTGLLFIGIAGVLIGASFIVFGVNATAQFFNTIVSLVHDDGYVSDLSAPNADSELRFYSVFWIAYGVILIQTALALQEYWQRVPWLLGLFFAGGCARLASYLSLGAPHLLFVVLLVIELVLPLLLGAIWYSTRRTKV